MVKILAFTHAVTGNVEGCEQKSDKIPHFVTGRYLKKKLLGSSCGSRQNNWDDLASLVQVRN